MSTNLSLTATNVGYPTVPNVNNPASQSTNASWSSSGLFIQTRPNVNRYTVLMGKFVNNTGTNAAQINIAYQLTMAGPLAVEEAGKGTHVYYSLTGLAGSWMPLPTLNNLTNTGTFALSTNLALSWPVGGKLYLLWADDNRASAPIRRTRSTTSHSRSRRARRPALAISVTAPTNGTMLYLYGPTTFGRQPSTYGTAPYTVEYFLSSGAGNPFSRCRWAPRRRSISSIGALGGGHLQYLCRRNGQRRSGRNRDVDNEHILRRRSPHRDTAPAEGRRTHSTEHVMP